MIADAKSGFSGAGRDAEAAGSLKAYAVPGHRHLPEIGQGLQDICGHPVGLTFVLHLAPMIRGIHATLYARPKEVDASLQEIFEARYTNEPFVDVMPQGSHPETRSVRADNTFRLAIHRPRRGDVLVVLSVIDNLLKGAAGQAVQNLNIMFGLDEALALDAPAVLP